MGEDAILYDTNEMIKAMKEGGKLKGFTTILNLIEFPKGIMLDLSVIVPSLKDYALALEMSQKMVETGSPIPAVDLIIAAVALNNDLTLKTADKHFIAIKKSYPSIKLEIS
ncbi:MAG: hypothetical protein PWQ22_733 [Archaeoglobaceae archaeon]|nr:hypothetical protein [Archaeoglobaceae archaeon]